MKSFSKADPYPTATADSENLPSDGDDAQTLAKKKARLEQQNAQWGHVEAKEEQLYYDDAIRQSQIL